MKKALLEIDPNEVVLHEFKRHPIGIFAIVGVALLIIIALFGVFFFLASNREQFNIQEGMTTITTFFAVVCATVIGGALVAVNTYRQNELIVTNESIIQIIQHSVFGRRISQLNLSKVQDVSGDQDTMVEHMFNFGVVTIETAGEAANFRFPYTRDPQVCAKHIIEAHEQFIRQTSGGAGLPHTSV